MITLTPQDIAFSYSVGIPFFFGSMAGWLSLDRRFSGLMAISGISLIVIGQWSEPTLLALTDYRIQLLSMAALWMTLGIFVGWKGHKYVNTLGPLAWFFTLSLGLMTASAGELTVYGVKSIIFNGNWNEAQTALNLYGPFLILSIIILIQFSRMGLISYLFNWDNVTANKPETEILRGFLKNKYNIEWIKDAKIEKIDNGNSIKISTEKDSLLLKLNDEKTKLNLEINDVRTDELEVIMKNDKLNVYRFTAILWKLIVKKLLIIFSFFGLVELIVEQFWDEFISSVLWWIPQVNAPDYYQAFFTIGLAFMLSLPFSGSLSRHNKQVTLDTVSVLNVLSWEEGVYVHIPLVSKIPFRYNIPKDWIVVQDKQLPDKFSVRIRCPSWSRWNSSSIDLLVLQCTLETLPDSEFLKRNSHENLLATHAIIIKEDKINTLHGVPSYGCFYKENMSLFDNYGYVVNFIISNNQFVIRWLSSDAVIFHRYLPDVYEFINSFQFQNVEMENG